MSTTFSFQFLIVDTPPGTSDEHLSIVQYLANNLDGAIIITTPQEVALLDVRKEVDFCRKVNLPILGVVENMSYFKCGKCDKNSVIWPALTGGAEKLAQELQVPLLASIPVDPAIGKACDEGLNPFTDNEELKSNASIQAYLKVAEAIRARCQ